MRLYSYWRSTSSWRVRIALALKGVPCEIVPVHLLKDGGEQYLPAHRARNPMAQVPVLEWEENGTTVHLSQSMAIIEYLEETHPEPPLLPRDALSRARARMLAEHVNSGIQPLQNAAVLQRIRALAPSDAVRPDAAWASYWVARGLAGLEEAVRPHAGTCCVGDSISLPDAYLVPQMYAARRFDIDLSPYPTLARIDDSLSRHPAFAAAHADAQPDAPPREPARRP